MIAVGSDDINTTNRKVFLCEYNELSCQWTKTKSVCIKQPVHDVQFAPNMGRPFYLLGVATKNVHVLKIIPIMYVIYFCVDIQILVIFIFNIIISTQ